MQRAPWWSLVVCASLATTAAGAQPMIATGPAGSGFVVRRAPPPPACTPRVLGGHNYFFCPVSLGYDAARDYCHAFHTELAIVGSRYENDALADVVRAFGRGRHLIGHHDRVTEGRFETVDGSVMSFSAWASGEPNNVNDEDCVELDGSSVWNDIPCATGTANVLCEESPSCTVEFFGDHLYHACRGTTERSPEAQCRWLGAQLAVSDSPAEAQFLDELTASAGGPWCGAPTRGAVVCETPSPCVRRYLDGRTYLFCLRPDTTAVEARRACVGLGGALAVIDDARTNEFVYASFATFRRTHFYFDLRDDDTEGRFYSRRGPATFTAWAPGEPNNVNNEDCVELADTGWNDVPCTGDMKNAFVCELPPPR